MFPIFESFSVNDLIKPGLSFFARFVSALASGAILKYLSPQRLISVITGSTFSRSNYYRAAADYTRKIGGRLFAGVNVSARKVTEAGLDPDADFSGSLFIRYRFGDVQ